MMRERGAHQLAEPRRGDLLARGVDGSEVGRRPRGTHVIALDVEPVPAELAAQTQVGPRRQLLREPRLVEPGGADCAGAVADPSRDDRPPAAEPARPNVDDLTRDCDLLVAPELRDGDLVDRLLVP